MEGIQYYGGIIEGIASVFGTVRKINNYPVYTIFDETHVTGYQAFPRADCPFCKKGMKIEAVVNAFGYSRV